MKDFTLRKKFLDCKSGTSSLFKGFVMLVVLMLMTTSLIRRQLHLCLKLIVNILVILLFQRRLRVMMG